MAVDIFGSINTMVYNEVVNNQTIYRTFEPDSISSSELVWHRDKSDRKVYVTEGEHWKFQFDNELPFDLAKGDFVVIKANVYHRLIKKDNSTTLKITIEEG